MLKSALEQLVGIIKHGHQNIMLSLFNNWWDYDSISDTRKHEYSFQLLWVTLWHQNEALRVCSFQSFDFRADSSVKTLPYYDRKLTCFFLPLKLLSSFGIGFSHHTWALNIELVNRLLANSLKISISSQQVQKLLYWITLRSTTVSLTENFTRVLKNVQRVLFFKVD